MPLRSTNNKNTLEGKPWNDWTLYAELQGRKTDGRQGRQWQRRASGACGMG